jgi:two-component sensor histidine kinase
MVSDDHEGFGTFLGRATVEGQLGGRIAYDWRDEGLQIALNLPRDCLTRR